MELNAKKNISYAWALGRFVNYAAQQRILPIIDKLATGRSPYRPEQYEEKMKELLSATRDLLRKDSENIANGVYPTEVLRPEAPWTQTTRAVKIFLDSFFIAKRRGQKKHKQFAQRVAPALKDAPAYYRRNFHFQTDGYFSEQSADLYDHQVEILFAGAADPMRRMAISVSKKFISDKRGLQFLELACGTGRLTRFMSLSFPKSKILAVDPSEPYLKKAEVNLKNAKGVSLLKAFAEKLPIKKSKYDFVYSSFLFHELPRKVRHEVMKESIRVAKNGAYIAVLDSIQLQDDIRFDWALRRFPIDFHEPFFKDYSQDSMESWTTIFPELELVAKEQGLLAKVCLFQVKKNLKK